MSESADYVPKTTTINGFSLNTSINLTGNDVLPSQSSQSGKFLTTNGTTVSWATVSGGGDVSGGSTSIDGELAAYNGTTGKILKQSFVAFSGPATTVKTYTLPNSSQTIETQNNKDFANGYAGLTSGTKLNLAQGQEVWTLADLSDVSTKTGTGSTVVMDTSPTIVTPTIAKLANLTANGFVKTSGGDGTLSIDTATYLTGNQTITLSGDVTGSGTTAITTTIGTNIVTNSMLAQTASATFKGRTTAGTGNVEDLTATQATALLNTFTSTLKGLVPSSGGGTTNFLRADGTWAAPSGGGSPTWGSITGTLSNQTDLQSALDAKQATLTAGSLIDLSGATVDVDLSEATSTTIAIDDTLSFTDVSASNANAKGTLQSVNFEYAKLKARYGFTFYTDFIQETSATATDGAMSETNSGTGAATSAQATSNSGRPGHVRSSTGTTATGRAALASSVSAIRLGGGAWLYETAVSVTTLSTSTERYQLAIGFIDTLSAANQVDAVYFLYDEGGVSTGSTASANWQLVSSNNSTRTFTTTSTAVAAGTFVRLGIMVNAAGTSVDYFINGTNVGTISTNIPTASGRELGFGSLIIKSVGTTARTVDYDYVNVVCDLTTAR